MSEPSKDSPEQEIPSLISEARRLLDQIREVKAQTEEQLKAVEFARKNTDSEALLAFNAKNACEGHATAIATLKGSVEAEVNSILTNKQKSDELLAAVNTGKATVDADIKTINDRRKEVDQSALEIVKAAEVGASRLKDLDASKNSADASLKLANEATTAATQASASADAANKQAQKSSGQATTLTSAISEYQKLTKQHSEETQALLLAAQTNEANLKKVLDHLTKSDDIATGHEARVEKLSTDLESLIKRVEGLLPGATSAGLASSFNKQKERFLDPQRNWLWTFVGCIIGLVIVAIPSFFSAIGIHWYPINSTENTWDATWRSLTMRLPIVLPLVWLGIYAGRNYMISLRLEEDYAYKEAISTSFEGYKREMEKITVSDMVNPTPLTIPSGVRSKAANGDYIKTGQRIWPGT
jgi:chromosome segregation ATPase